MTKEHRPKRAERFIIKSLRFEYKGPKILYNSVNKMDSERLHRVFKNKWINNVRYLPTVVGVPVAYAFLGEKSLFIFRSNGSMTYIHDQLHLPHHWFISEE